MAHNVQKFIHITGKPRELAEIYRWVKNFKEKTILVNRKDGDYQLGAFVSAFDEEAGKRGEVIDHRGWSYIEWLDWSSDGNTLVICCLTPYGNLSDFMPWLRKRFPLCDCRCFADEDNSDDLIENEYD